MASEPFRIFSRDTKMNEEQQQEYDGLTRRLSIHIHLLHKDAQQQPDLVFRAGELAAELKAETKRARLAVDEVIAEVNQSIRADPEKHGLVKITEGAVTTTLNAHPDVLKPKLMEINAALSAQLLG